MYADEPIEKGIIKTTYSGADIIVYAVVSPNELLKAISQWNNFHEEIDPQLDVLRTPGDEETAAKAKEIENSLIKKDIEMKNEIGKHYKRLAELQTCSYSIYRGKEQVKALGQSQPRGYTRGYVTIAGTMIFTVFDRAVLAELIKMDYNESDYREIRIDQLPPLDIFIIFTNEFGQTSKLALFGVEFMNEGQVMSVSDLITENSVNYVARHFQRMENISSIYPDYKDIAFINSFNFRQLPVDAYNQAYNEIKSLKKYFL
jgi:hypothetical protein